MVSSLQPQDIDFEQEWAELKKDLDQRKEFDFRSLLRHYDSK